MSNIPHFHGSDIEAIEIYYDIPKEQIIGFGANVNPLGLSETVKSEIAKHLDIMTTYPDRNYVTLRQAISKYCKVAMEHIIVGNGSTELISLLIQHLNPQKALLLGPTYSEYERELSLCGGKIVPYHLNPENEFQIQLPHFLEQLTDDINLLILCNPNNPTSSAISVSELEKIVEHCLEHHIFVMVDETYVEFTPDIDKITGMPLVADYSNLMIIRGVSKFFAAPGLRFGYGVTSNAAFLSELHKYQNPWSLNSVAALAGELMFHDETYIQRTRELIASERQRILQTLKEIPNLHTFEPIANFFLVKILKPGISSADVFDYCIRRKLMIRDCSSFESLEGEYFRFCIMNPEENTKLLETLKELF